MSTTFAYSVISQALAFHSIPQLEDVISTYDWLLEQYLTSEPVNTREQLVDFVASKLAVEPDFAALAEYLVTRDVEQLLQITRDMGVYDAFIQQEFHNEEEEEEEEEEEFNPALFLNSETILQFVAPVVIERAINSSSPANVLSIPCPAVSIPVEVIVEPAVVEPVIHPTTFTRYDNEYILTVDSSKETATTRYLDTHNCEFSRYFSSNGYTRFTIFNAPASVIDSISKKYPAPAPVVVEEPAVVEEVEEVPAPVSLLEHVVTYLDEEPVSADDLRETIAYLSSFLPEQPAAPSPQYGYTEADLEAEQPEEKTQANYEPRTIDMAAVETDLGIMAAFLDCTTRDQVRKLYRELSKTYHPDNGGNPARFQALTREYEEALWLLEPALV